jgi:hypothetical protein
MEVVFEKDANGQWCKLKGPALSPELCGVAAFAVCGIDMEKEPPEAFWYVEGTRGVEEQHEGDLSGNWYMVAKEGGINGIIRWVDSGSYGVPGSLWDLSQKLKLTGYYKDCDWVYCSIYASCEQCLDFDFDHYPP